MSEVSEATKKLISHYKLWQRSVQLPEEAATIHVDEIAARVAAFYEKIRGVIDWREEHLLKIGAIERMLKRRLFTKISVSSGDFSGQALAEPLVLELIRGGIFPNDQIPERKIEEVQKIVDKYVHIINNSSGQNKKSRLQLYHWLSSIAACEIEDALAPSVKEKALISYMFDLMKEQIRLNVGNISEEEKNIQIYIAVQRALFKLDTQIISYHLLKYWYPDWTDISEAQLKEISDNIFSFWDYIEKALNHPLGDKLYKVCERYDTAYLILGDVVGEDPSNIEEKIVKPENLAELIRKHYGLRLKTLKSRLGRAALYATISIFVTKIATALAIEVPIDKYLTGHFDSLAITIDSLFPPLLMFFLIATIRPPKKVNIEQVVMEVVKIAYVRETKDIYEIKSDRKRSHFLNYIVSLVYLLSFLVSVGLIVFILTELKFSVLSQVIFILFLSLIAFAGTKLRQRAKELHVREEKESFLGFLLDLFSLPLVQLGNWLTSKWRKYNIISALFNALIDLPFTIFVEFLEQWRTFLREKKEKIH